jgi:DNA primase
MGTWIDFKELRSAVKIADVLALHHVQLKMKGDRASAFCPLPEHKRNGDGKRHSPSFSVHLGKGIFQCFSCGAKGNTLDLFCFLQGLDPGNPSQLREGALLLREKFLSPEKPVMDTRKTKAPSSGPEKNERPPGKVVVNAPLDFTLKHLDPKHAYLSSRGFTPETIEHFGLGYCNKGMMAERTAIPLHDAAGKLIGYAGRLVDDAKVSDENPKYRFPGTRERDGIAYEFHKSEFLYNGHGIDKPVPDLIVVEGFASVWWLWQHGYPNVVALMGNSISVKQAELLRDLLGCDGRLWILSDGDNAGEHCAKALFLNLAPHHFVRWLRLDDGQPTDLSSEELDALLPPQTA